MRIMTQIRDWLHVETRTNYRLTLSIPKETVDKLDAISARTNSGDMKETVSRSLALLDVVSKEMELGADLFVRYADGTEREIIIS